MPYDHILWFLILFGLADLPYMEYDSLQPLEQLKTPGEY